MQTNTPNMLKGAPHWAPIETRATLAAVYWLTSAAAGICLVSFLGGLWRLSWAPPYFSQNTETRASGSD